MSNLLAPRELRGAAVSRLAEIAGYDERLDVRAVLRRSDSLAILERKAMRACAGDALLLDEVRRLGPIARGDAAALDEALHESGLPVPTAPAATVVDVDEFEQIVRQELGL